MADFTASPKDPIDVRPLGLDFKAYLRKPPEVVAAETITDAQWSVSPSGLGIEAMATIDGSKISTVVSVGTAGVTYTLAVHVTTSLGMEYRRTIELAVESR